MTNSQEKIDKQKTPERAPAQIKKENEKSAEALKKTAGSKKVGKEDAGSMFSRIENDRFTSEETARTAHTHQSEPIHQPLQRPETHDAHRTTSPQSEHPAPQAASISSNDGGIPWGQSPDERARIIRESRVPKSTSERKEQTAPAEKKPPEAAKPATTPQGLTQKAHPDDRAGYFNKLDIPPATTPTDTKNPNKTTAEPHTLTTPENAARLKTATPEKNQKAKTYKEESADFQMRMNRGDYEGSPTAFKAGLEHAERVDALRSGIETKKETTAPLIEAEKIPTSKPEESKKTKSLSESESGVPAKKGILTPSITEKPKPAETEKPAETADDFQVTQQAGDKKKEQELADQAAINARRTEAEKTLTKDSSWSGLNGDERAKKIDNQLKKEDDENMAALKEHRKSMKGYGAMDGTKKEEVSKEDPKLQEIQRQKPIVKEKLPESTNREQPVENAQTTTGKMTKHELESHYKLQGPFGEAGPGSTDKPEIYTFQEAGKEYYYDNKTGAIRDDMGKGTSLAEIRGQKSVPTQSSGKESGNTPANTPTQKDKTSHSPHGLSAVTENDRGESPVATKENGKATPPTITPTKVNTPGDAALDGYLAGDDTALTREMRRDRNFMANAVEKAQDRLIDAVSESSGTDVRKTIDESGTSNQLGRLNTIDKSHHADMNITTKQTLKKVMSGYYKYDPTTNIWTDQSQSIVVLPAEQKEAVGKFLRKVQPDHPYAKLTAEHDPYNVSRGNNPFQGAHLDPRIHSDIVDFNAQIGAHRPFEEELKHIRETMKKIKPKIERPNFN